MLTDQMLLLAAVASGIPLLAIALVIVVRTRKISDQLSELDALSEELKTIFGAMETRIALLQAGAEINRQHADEINLILEASRSLREWQSRMTEVYLDAGYLFESEPIRELIDQFGPRLTHVAEPLGRSDGRSTGRVRPDARDDGVTLLRERG